MRTNKVSAMANTPSLNASTRELSARRPGWGLCTPSPVPLGSPRGWLVCHALDVSDTGLGGRAGGQRLEWKRVPRRRLSEPPLWPLAFLGQKKVAVVSIRICC